MLIQKYLNNLKLFIYDIKGKKWKDLLKNHGTKSENRDIDNNNKTQYLYSLQVFPMNFIEISVLVLATSELYLYGNDGGNCY